MKFDFGKMLFLAIFLSIFGLGGLVWPVFVFGMIFSALSSSDRKTKTTKKTVAKKTTIDKAKITRNQHILKDYFQNNSSLELENGIVVQPYQGRFTTVDMLYLYKEDDQIATLEEFRKSYPSTYDDLLEQCVLCIEKGVTTNRKTPMEPKREKLNTIEQFIETLNELNVEISNEQVTQGLYEVTAYLKQINVIVKEFPESREKTKKLTQYYLPILVEILQSYQQLSKSAHQHEEFRKTEERLQKTILLINEALKTITYTLTQEYFMDLSADMSTLEALLKKDGLVSEGSISSLRKQVKTNE